MGWPFNSDLNDGDPLHKVKADDLRTVFTILDDIEGDGCYVEKTPNGYGWRIVVTDGGGGGDTVTVDALSVNLDGAEQVQQYGWDTAASDTTNFDSDALLSYKDNTDSVQKYVAPEKLAALIYDATDSLSVNKNSAESLQQYGWETAASDSGLGPAALVPYKDSVTGEQKYANPQALAQAIYVHTDSLSIRRDPAAEHIEIYGWATASASTPDSSADFFPYKSAAFGGITLYATPETLKTKIAATDSLSTDRNAADDIQQYGWEGAADDVTGPDTAALFTYKDGSSGEQKYFNLDRLRDRVYDVLDTVSVERIGTDSQVQQHGWSLASTSTVDTLDLVSYKDAATGEQKYANSEDLAKAVYFWTDSASTQYDNGANSVQFYGWATASTTALTNTDLIPYKDAGSGQAQYVSGQDLKTFIANLDDLSVNLNDSSEIQQYGWQTAASTTITSGDLLTFKAADGTQKYVDYDDLVSQLDTDIDVGALVDTVSININGAGLIQWHGYDSPPLGTVDSGSLFGYRPAAGGNLEYTDIDGIKGVIGSNHTELTYTADDHTDSAIGARYIEANGTSSRNNMGGVLGDASGTVSIDPDNRSLSDSFGSAVMQWSSSGVDVPAPQNYLHNGDPGASGTVQVTQSGITRDLVISGGIIVSIT